MTTVEADAVPFPLVHPGIVNIVEVMLVHAVIRRVVEKMAVVPASALITIPEVAEAIVDPAIETYGHSPVALIEIISAVAPTPISRSPELSHFRRLHLHVPGTQ